MSLLAKLKRSFRNHRRPHRLTSSYRGRGTARCRREVHLILRTLQCVGTTGASREHSNSPEGQHTRAWHRYPGIPRKQGIQEEVWPGYQLVSYAAI